MQIKKFLVTGLLAATLLSLAILDYYTNYFITPLYFIPLAFLAVKTSLNTTIFLSFLTASGSAFGQAFAAGQVFKITEIFNFLILFTSFSVVAWFTGSLRERIAVNHKYEARTSLSNTEKVDNQYLNGFISSYLEVLEAKDPFLKQHSINVANYSRRIGSELKMSKDKVQELYWAGLLHDIGKVVIPNGVLNIPINMMSDREKISFYQHAEIGSRIVEHIPDLKNVAKMILHHHESYKQSPIGSRILAVADIFDKLTNSKSYLKVYSSTYALEEIKAQYRGQFDPLVLEALEKATSLYDQEELNKKLA